MYCNKQHLATLISQAHEVGQVSEELALAIYRVGHGVWQRHGLGRRAGMEQDDFAQTFVVRMLKKIDGIKAVPESFNYLTTCAIQLLKWFTIKNVRKMELFEAYREEKIVEFLAEIGCRKDTRHEAQMPRLEGHFGRIRK